MDFSYFSLLIPIMAAATGAFLGFIWQSKNDKNKDKKQLLGILMAYRGLTAREDDFVKALNMIDVFFYDSKEVRNILHDYFKHLYKPLYETGHHNRILLQLILAMAKNIGYTDLKESDITDYYYPERYALPTPKDDVTPQK